MFIRRNLGVDTNGLAPALIRVDQPPREFSVVGSIGCCRMIITVILPGDTGDTLLNDDDDDNEDNDEDSEEEELAQGLGIKSFACFVDKRLPPSVFFFAFLYLSSLLAATESLPPQG
ncbi:predicted protein [Histoplasma capsulatum G186AR]|uniref:Uncharacterized protein n=1 Tax=Ajellomyces capsulatus (strain G186AR / H82 / ATCC MYA-2454 / RMSCC 2432) TaxID=447093 RepID=C0NMM4_AJECG|nr:uncharacterized protein HCBG_04001 [Histoplasma capsulatum G186AR]EEH07122.1 predicted protein [Histoplasma capsulatum G186AR]